MTGLLFRLAAAVLAGILLATSAAVSESTCKSLARPGGGFIAAPAPEPAGDDTFTDVRGNKIRLSDLKGRPLLVNFWTTWCPPCIAEMPSMDRLQRRLKSSGLLVLPLVRDSGGTQAAVDFYVEHGIKHLPALADRWGKLTHKNRIGALPQTMLIDRDGREVGRVIGGIDWEAPEVFGLLEACLGVSEDVKGG